MDFLKLIQAAPALAKSYQTLERARRGEQQLTPSDLLSIGIDVADGAGVVPRTVAEEAIRQVGQTVAYVRGARSGDIIDGEYREVEAAPWSDFKRHLLALKSGALAVFGARGEGKTTLAVAVGYALHKRTGYPVYCVNFDPKDVPEWATRKSMQSVTNDVRTIIAYLNPPDLEETKDDEEEDNDEGKPRKRKKRTEQRVVTEKEIAAISGRIIIFDEASLGFGQFAPGGKLTARATVIQLMNYCRHVDTIVIFIGQMIKQLPKDLRSDTIMMYKQPDPEIEKQDGSGDDNLYCRERWAEVKAALNQVPYSQWYRPPYDNMKSWSYVAAGKIGGHSYYGTFCSKPAPKRLTEAA